MKINSQFVRQYIENAPLALALERSMECYIFAQQEFEHPILDIGCGDGIFATAFFGEKVDVGIDFNSEELKRAKNSGMYKELICCGGQQIPKQNGSFKTIFANSVLEHIVPIRDVLKEARRLLANEGRIYVTVPTDMFERYTITYQLLSILRLDFLAEHFRKFFNDFWQHYHCYDAESWQKLFEECGLSVSQHREYNSKISCLLNDSLVPLGLLSFLSRKFFKRWFFIPSMRRLYSPVLIGIFEKIIERRFVENKNGGLIFFELKKVT